MHMVHCNPKWAKHDWVLIVATPIFALFIESTLSTLSDFKSSALVGQVDAHGISGHKRHAFSLGTKYGVPMDAESEAVDSLSTSKGQALTHIPQRIQVETNCFSEIAPGGLSAKLLACDLVRKALHATIPSVL